MQQLTGQGMALQWMQLIMTTVGMITLFIKIGIKQGNQDEKNKNFEENIKEQRKEINEIKADISEIKRDVSYIKGKLL